MCDQQTRKFNEEAARRRCCFNDFCRFTICSKRWCASNGLDNVITLSDHKDLSFGQQYGVVMEELRLLARSVFVLDSNDKVVYKELVSEGTDFPNFDLCIRSISQHLISILDDRYNVKVSIFISKMLL